MTKRDFLTITIKLIALFIVLTAIGRNINYVFQSFGIPFIDNGNVGDYALMFFSLLIGIIIEIVSFVLIIMYTDKFVNAIKLGNSFDSGTFNFGKLNSTEIIKVGCFVIGSYLIITSSSELIYQSIMLFKFETGTSNDPYSDARFIDYKGLAINVLNVIIGYIVMVNFDWIAKFLYKPIDLNE